MPRRKVIAENRQRAPKACDQCKQSKKRCDSTQPCAKCVQKGIGDACMYSGRFSQVENRIYRAPPENTTIPQTARESTKSTTPRSHGRRTDAAVEDAEGESESPGEARHRLRSRLMSDAHGGTVFVGSSASLAFLQFIRDLVAGSVGMSDFTHSTGNASMLEMEESIHPQEDIRTELSNEEKFRYARRFCVATKGLIEFVTDADIPPLFSIAKETKPQPIADMVLAIGAQNTPLDTLQPGIEARSLRSAQNAAYAGMLESPSIESVKLFLLLAYYMVQACRRNAAFMYIGVAARAAQALGLSTPEYYRNLGVDTRKQHMLVWKSLVNLDVIVGSILGRATTTLVYDPNAHQNATPSSDIDATTDALDACFRMSELVHDIVTNLYKKASVTTQDAEGFLSRMNTWSQSLPVTLRLNNVPDAVDHDSLSLTTGCLHLLSRLLAERSPSQSGYTSDDPNRAILANRCVTAATYMAQSCSEVLQAGFLIESAPILKAWLFAAGLVLGLQMFVLDRADTEVEAAFVSARQVLQKLGMRSAQATHYYEILGHLGGVVVKKQQERGLKACASSNFEIMKPINFNVASADLSEPSTASQGDQFDTLEQNFAFGEDGVGSIDDLLFSMQDNLVDYNDILLGWNQAAPQF